jgi:hypothetical protein
MKTIVSFAAAALAAAALAAGAPAATPVVLDTSPAPGAAGVPWRANPSVTFSTDMDPASFTTASARILRADGTQVPAVPAYDPATRTLTLRRASALDLAGTYTVRLDATVRAADGSPLGAPYTFAFTTAATMAPYRVNCAGATLVGGDGLAWDPDTGVKGGYGRTVLVPIANTPEPSLFQTTREGTWTYALNVPKGTYTITLSFVETLFTQRSRRVFSVDLLATPASPDISRLDIVAATGGPNRALVRTITGVNLAQGLLSIRSIASVGEPTIAAIEAVRTG